MPQIVGAHESRLRTAAPYRIPTSQLQAGAATPSRGEDIDMGDLPPSRPVSPMFGFGAPPQMAMLRAATPAYTPAPDALLFIPESRGPTPFTFDGRTPTPFPQHVGSDAREGMESMPLFMAGSRGPTPYAYEFCSPTPFSEGALPERRAGPSSPPPPKRRRTECSPPPRRRLKNLEAYFFDVAAEDSDEDDGEEEGEEDDGETLSDIGQLFIRGALSELTSPFRIY